MFPRHRNTKTNLACRRELRNSHLLRRAHSHYWALQLPLPNNALLNIHIRPMRPIGLQNSSQPTRRLRTPHPLIHRLLLQTIRIIALRLHEMRPELFLAALDQHLRHVRHPQKWNVPVPHACLVVLPRYVFSREERLLRETLAQNHLAETEMRDARGIQPCEAEAECGAAVFAMDGEPFVAELVHEGDHVFGIGCAVVAL